MPPQPAHMFESVADLSEIESVPVSIAIVAKANSCIASGKATARIKTNARRQ
jgi:hypothetical protein